MLGEPAAVFADSDMFLLSRSPGDFDAFVVEQDQSGVTGLDLLRLIRKGSPEAAIVFLADAPQAQVSGFEHGADVVLPLVSGGELVAAAVSAVLRRTRPPARGLWLFDGTARVLLTPRGAKVSLTPTDVAILEALAAHPPGRPVAREALRDKLWPGQGEDSQNALHATIYRLRRRIEQHGDIAPLHALAGRGYEFRAPLARSDAPRARRRRN